MRDGKTACPTNTASGLKNPKIIHINVTISIEVAVACPLFMYQPL